MSDLLYLLILVFCVLSVMVIFASDTLSLFPSTNIEHQTCEELLTIIQNESVRDYSTKAWIAQECWK